MTAENCTFEAVTFKDLVSFAEGVAANLDGGVVPVSRRAARRRALNPEAAPDDAALILARAPNGRRVGYLGLFPGLTRTANGVEKVAWASTVFVERRWRSPNLTDGLIGLALARYEHVTATGTVPLTAKILLRSGMHEVLADDSLRVRFSFFDPRLIAAKMRRTAAPLHSTAGREALARRLRPSAFTRTPTRLLNPLLLRLIEDQPARSFVRRGATIRWMVEHPWVIDSELQEDDRRYHFSVPGRPLTYHSVEISAKERPESQAGFILSEIDGPQRRVKLLDHCATDARARKTLLRFVLAEALQLGALSVVVPRALLQGSLLGWYCRMASKKIIQPYYLTSRGGLFPPGTPLQTSSTTDGDMAFW